MVIGAVVRRGSVVVMMLHRRVVSVMILRGGVMAVLMHCGGWGSGLLRGLERHLTGGKYLHRQPQCQEPDGDVAPT